MDRDEPEQMIQTAALAPLGEEPMAMATADAVSRYKDMVYSIALTHTRYKQDADDVFQEVFMAYHRKQPAFPSEERRKAWLITTTLNCSKQVTGSSWAKKVIPLNEAAAERLAKSDDDGFSFATAEQDAIFRAMQELPLSYRTVLHLFYFVDMPIAGIAQALDMQPGTVRVQLSRGRNLMRDVLKGASFDE